jgi:hypothetical protein
MDRVEADERHGAGRAVHPENLAVARGTEKARRQIRAGEIRRRDRYGAETDKGRGQIGRGDR